jgi:hypothetical protein
MIINMYNILKLLKKIMQSAQEQAKFYVNNSWCPREFEVSDKMFLKVKPLKSHLRLGKCPKLSL